MKKMNKFIRACAVTALALVSVVAVTSCSKEDKSKTIVFYHTMGQTLQPTLATAVEKFQKENPGWKVSASQVGGYPECLKKCKATLQAKTQPDVAYCYSDHVAQYLTTQKVIDMKNLIYSTETITKEDGSTINVGMTAEEIADFTPVYWQEGYASNYAGATKYGYAEDSILTVPYVKSTEVLYYNKTVLDQMKISVPTTWDELWAACEKIKAKYPSTTPLGYDSEGNWFISMCQQNGWGYTDVSTDNYYKFNSPETTEWLSFLQNQHEKGYFITQEEYNSYTSGLFKLGTDGGCIFVIGSTGGASNQATSAFDYAIAPIPGSVVNGEVVNAAISQGPSLVMFDQDGDTSTFSEKELMTWIFISDYLLDPQYQTAFSQVSGYNPVRESCYDEDLFPEYATFLESDKIQAKAVATAKEMRSYQFTSPAFNGSSNARDQVGLALYYASIGEKTAEEALRDAMRNCGA